MATKLIRSLYNVSEAMQAGVMTIGNFDGVHLGHQALVESVVAAAKARACPSLVMTFEPHPFEFFAGDQLTIPRLTRLREKFVALAALGMDFVIILPFNQGLANETASNFIKNSIVNPLHPQHLIIGDDFHFGHQRMGNITLLQTLGQTLSFTVATLPTVVIAGERVSSTRVRKALAAGDHALVARLLGRPYSLLGRVRAGDQLGRQWGYPTANIYLHRKLTPVHGVYTVRVHGIDSEPLPGVANVGTRPTVDGMTTLLEVHLLDFNRDIYGRYVQVEFCEKLRNEIRYSHVNQLIEQIAKDVAVAKKYFNKE